MKISVCLRNNRLAALLNRRATTCKTHNSCFERLPYSCYIHHYSITITSLIYKSKMVIYNLENKFAKIMV